MNRGHALLFRCLLFEILLLQALYQPGLETLGGWPWALLFAYGLYAGLIYRLQRPQNPILRGPWPFIGDVAATTILLAFSRGVSSEFYVVYFLVILATCLLQKPAASFLVGGCACLVYGFAAWPDLSGEGSATHLLRLCLLLTTTFFSALVVDTVRRSFERKAQEYRDQVAWLERLSTAGRIVAAVLHDLKTPVNTIVMNAENTRTLIGRPEASERMKEQLQMIEDEAERVAQILRDFLDFTKPGNLETSPLPLRPLVEKAYARVSPGLNPRAVSFQNSVSPQTRVLGSEHHLLQAFINLFDNALRAMPFGGRLDLSEICGRGQVKLVLMDTGEGIAPERLPNLFQAFESTRSQEGGHGLGLYAARWIVERHQGTIRIDSDGPQKGARVTLALPLAP